MSRGAPRLLALLWLGLATATTLPYLAAPRLAPAGSRFEGILFYVDDHYQYLSFAEQASRGKFLFLNKFDARPQQPVLVNLEWWLAGALGRLLGGSLTGFHVIRLVALAALLCASHRVLALAGRTGAEAVWGVVLVATGGGLGWLRLATGTPGWQVPDVLTGLYAWHKSLFNTHSLVGVTLLTCCLLLYLRWRSSRGPRWAWLGSAWALGLARPYDLAAFVVAVVGAEAWTARRQPGQLAGRLLELFWLLPVFFYYALVVGAHPSYAGWLTQAGDLSPPLSEYAFALAPGAALVLAFGRGPRAAGLVRASLLAWCAGVAGLLLLAPPPLARQSVASLGTGLLLWAAASVPGRLLPWAALALSPTSAFLLWRAFNPFPDSFAPAPYFDAVRFLRAACSPGRLALAPSELSLMIAGLTPCHVAVGHRLLTPDFPREVALAKRFYDVATPVAWRLAYLRVKGFSFVALPAGRTDMLGGSAAWRRVLGGPLLDLFESHPAGR